MTDTDLDTSYSALCEALAQAGQERAPLFLSMVCLSLMARMPDAAAVLPLIEQAKKQLADKQLAEKADAE